MNVRIFDILLPREAAFFDYMATQAELFNEACKEFRVLMGLIGKVPESRIHAQVAKIQDYEDKGDDLERLIIEELDRTFITPLDREDIHSIVMHIDNSIDMVNDTSQKIDIYRIKRVPKNVTRFVEIIVELSEELKILVEGIRDKGDVRMISWRIHKLENEADRLFHNSLAELFDTKDPIGIIKLKEIYERLEDIVNSVHHIGKIVTGIMVKQG